MKRWIEMMLCATCLGLLGIFVYSGIRTVAIGATEQPMTPEEREVIRIEHAKWRRLDLMLAEVEYADDNYVKTRPNHQWCSTQLRQAWTDRDAAQQELARIKQILLDRKP